MMKNSERWVYIGVAPTIEQRRANMTRRPETQEQATKMVDALTAKAEAIEAERMKLVGDFSPEAMAQFKRFGGRVPPSH